MVLINVSQRFAVYFREMLYLMKYLLHFSLQGSLCVLLLTLCLCTRIGLPAGTFVGTGNLTGPGKDKLDIIIVNVHAYVLSRTVLTCNRVPRRIST